MSEAFEKQIDKRISEMCDRIRKSRFKNKAEIITFSQRIKKAWKNIDEIKPN